MRSLLRHLIQNWKLKLLALALALLLWVVVSAEQVTSNWIPVPLTVRVDDPRYRLIEGSAPQEVEVRFSGPGRELWDLVIRRPPLLLAVDDIDGIEDIFDLEPRMVQVPNQLSVSPQDVRPTAVTLRFVRMASRQVPVQLRIGRGPEGDRTLVDALRVEPRSVRITGAAERLAEIDVVRTLPLDLSEVDSVFSVTAPLDTSQLGGARVSSARVQVSGAVDRVVERAFAAVPVSVGPGIVIDPVRTEVRVRGAQRSVGQLAPRDLRVVIAIDSIPDRVPPEGILVPLRVERLPAGATAALEPGRVRLFPARPEPATPELAGTDTTTARPMLEPW